MKLRRLVDIGAFSLVGVCFLMLTSLFIFTVFERDSNGTIQCLVDYNLEQTLLEQHKDDPLKFNELQEFYKNYISCPNVFKTTVRCCWRFSFMAMLVCIIVTCALYLIMRISCLDYVCSCPR